MNFGDVSTRRYSSHSLFQINKLDFLSQKEENPKPSLSYRRKTVLKWNAKVSEAHHCKTASRGEEKGQFISRIIGHKLLASICLFFPSCKTFLQCSPQRVKKQKIGCVLYDHCASRSRLSKFFLQVTVFPWIREMWMLKSIKDATISSVFPVVWIEEQYSLRSKQFCCRL